MSDGDETMPPTSGVVEGDLRVVVCSTRVGLVGAGAATTARDVADLLMSIDDHGRIALVIDAKYSPIELGFLARLARDFPPSVSILVQGNPAEDRLPFHGHGVYRAQFDPSDDGALPDREGIIACDDLIARVIAKLERLPTPLIALKGGK